MSPDYQNVDLPGTDGFMNEQNSANMGDPFNASAGSRQAPSCLSPPRPPLVFRVGVEGHRPDRLGKADLDKLASVIHTGLNAVKEEVLSMRQATSALYANTEPVVRAISALAEGTDRIFADQALNMGFELCCVMPFPQAEFELDFAPGKALEKDSLSRFRQLLKSSSMRFELDGCRSDGGGAYGAGGRVLLNQSDLLVVVWDGERQNKRGGTEQMFDEACQSGVPILWIDAHAPHSCLLLNTAMPLPKVAEGERQTPCDSNFEEALRKCVRDALEMPKMPEQSATGAHASPGRKAEEPQRNLELFYREHQPGRNLAVAWQVFRNIVADGKVAQVKLSITPFEEDVENDWREDQSSSIAPLVDFLRSFYAWPDKLAMIYSDRYWSAFILSFLLSAAAVGMALLPVGARLSPHHGAETACIGLELAAILVILALVFQGRRRRWHERWLEYRLTAELIRHLKLVSPLGGARPFPRIPAHWATYGQPSATWMAWYVRAVERAPGLPSALVNKAHLKACLLHLRTELEQQAKFHEINAGRCHRIEERLHLWGMTLFTLTLICCGLHFLPTFWHGLEYPEWLLALLTFFCGFAPALGAALAGILNQGEFRRVAKRSDAMHDQLSMLLEKIENLRGKLDGMSGQSPNQFSLSIAALAGDAARLLINEALDWRVVFLDQPLTPPI